MQSLSSELMSRYEFNIIALFVQFYSGYFYELEQEYEILDLMDPECFKGVYEIDKTT